MTENSGIGKKQMPLYVIHLFFYRLAKRKKKKKKKNEIQMANEPRLS